MFTRELTTISGKIRVTIPATISELQIGQLIAIRDCEDITDLKAIAILSGISEEKLCQITNYTQLSVFNDKIQSIVHQLQFTYNEKAIPEYIVWGTETVKQFGLFKKVKPRKIRVIKNISMEPAGAYLASHDLIADEINKHIKEFGEDYQDKFKPDLKVSVAILANYFYCRVTGLPFNEQAAEEFQKEVEKLPVQTAMPIARYFFLSYPDFSSPKLNFWQAVRLKMKSKLASKSSNNFRSITK